MVFDLYHDSIYTVHESLKESQGFSVPQLSSPDPSLQSLCESQTKSDEMHIRLVHVNSCAPHSSIWSIAHIGRNRNHILDYSVQHYLVDADRNRRTYVHSQEAHFADPLRHNVQILKNRSWLAISMNCQATVVSMSSGTRLTSWSSSAQNTWKGLCRFVTSSNDHVVRRLNRRIVRTFHLGNQTTIFTL